MRKVSVKDIDIGDKKVLLRVDYNVPIGEDSKIQDDTRIILSLDTLKYALGAKSKIILISHLGRPKGKRIESMSLKPCAKHLSELLNVDVKFVDDCIGDKVKVEIESMKSGEIVMLENLRFYNEETKDNVDFAKQLASYAEVYVNDAFGAIHRAHASVYAVAEFFTSKGIGLLMEKELHFLDKVLEGKDHPFVAIIGGAKVSDKIEVIESLIQRVDKLFICGAMAFTFLKALNYDVGTSLVEVDKIEIAQSIMEKVGATKCKLMLPVDFLTVRDIQQSEEGKIIQVGKKFENRKGVDIGPETMELFRQHLQGAKLIFWNGPAGIFEIDAYAKGTLEIAWMLSSTQAVTIVGGGDTLSAVNKAKVGDKISHISTGGGASLEYISGKNLPGLMVLPDTN